VPQESFNAEAQAIPYWQGKRRSEARQPLDAP
jgi:hypothetical protein